MIADGHRVVCERVHREHHRIGGRIVFLVVVILERRALNRIARIDQENVFVFLPHLPDQSCDFCQPAVIWFVSVVIDREKISVLIGGAENHDVNPL